MDGIVDEVGLWSRALTIAEVTALYNAGAGLAYPFDGGGGTGATAGRPLVNAGLVNRGLVNGGLVN